jgi:hypothetical protein
MTGLDVDSALRTTATGDAILAAESVTLLRRLPVAGPRGGRSARQFHRTARHDNNSTRPTTPHLVRIKRHS